MMDTQYTVVFQSGLKQLVWLRSIILIYGDKLNCLHSPVSYVWLSIPPVLHEWSCTVYINLLAPEFYI